MRNAYRILLEEPEGKTLLGRPKHGTGLREPLNKLSVECQSSSRCRDLPPGLAEVVPRYPTLNATPQPSDPLI
jgi:hypothetical protein